MDAALLVLLLGHLATALEVPLDRKTTDHTPRSVFISESVKVPNVRGLFYVRLRSQFINKLIDRKFIGASSRITILLI